MWTIEQTTAFLGWSAVINYGLLLFSTLFLVLFRDWAVGLHSRLLGVDPKELPGRYFDYLGQYKILIIVFNIVPWVVLKIM